MWARLMLVCFLTNGLGAFGLRILTGLGLVEAHKFSYVALWYWSGFLLAAAIFIRSRTLPSRRENWVSFGMAVSSIVGQLGKAYALQYGVPGYVVFQVAPGGGLFLVVLVGIFFFRERVTKYGIGGIVFGLTALVMLTI